MLRQFNGEMDVAADKAGPVWRCMHEQSGKDKGSIMPY